MLAEATRPRTSWRTTALRVVAASLGLAVVIALGAIGSGAASPSMLAARWFTLLGLGVVGPVLVWAAAAPGRSPLRWVGYAAAALSAAAIVFTRPGAVLSTSTAPEWLCTALHLAVATPAVVLAVSMLRSMAPSKPRAIAAGLAVGTTGALLGELLCERDAAHVATFHLAAWALAAAAVVIASGLVKRRSWAP